MQSPLELPELLAHVFTHLSPHETLRASEVCKSWHAVANEPSVWRGRLQDTFAAAPAPGEDAKQAFHARWTASRSTKDALLADPSTLRKTPAIMAKSTAPLARPHRLAVGTFIMHRMEQGLLLRLTLLGLESGVARAQACVHTADVPAITAMGAVIGTQLKSRKAPMPRPRPTRRERA